MDEVQKLIDKSDWSNGRKEQVSLAYWDWCAFKGFEFKKKKYPRQYKIPYIPTEEELDQLIGGFINSPYTPFLQLLKECGFRPVEASRLKSNDFDLKRKMVTLNEPAKNSNPRQCRISEKLVRMISPIIARTPSNEKLWKSKLRNLTETIRRHRNKVAERLGNPNLKRITLRTIRHWFASTTYNKTKDLLYTQKVLGHKSIQSTLVYTHILADETTENYIVKVASSIEEFTKLLESGFEYISDYDGLKVLKKRK